MRKYFYLFALLAFFACNEEDRYTPNSQSDNAVLSTKADFIRLENGGTDLAGILEISTKESSVGLRWNVPNDCNLDTTLTSLPMVDGKVKLPIKWNKMLPDSTYAPSDKIFEAGVLVTAKDYSKYIRLLWTEGLDSAKVEKAPVFYGEARDVVLPKAGYLIIEPKIIYMSKDVDTYTLTVQTDQFNIRAGVEDAVNDNDTEGINFDVSTVEGNYAGYDKVNVIHVGWTDAGAPDKSFVTHIGFFPTTALYGYAHFIYNKDDVEEASFEYLRCSPEEDAILPATATDINVVVKTNQKWYIKSDQSAEGTKTGEASYPNGERLLTIKIDPNTSPAQRAVTVTVETDEGVKKTLSFIQSAPSKIFEFIEATPAPAPDFLLDAAGETIAIKVKNNNQPWWIEYNGVKTHILQKDSTGDCKIPANLDSAIKDVVLNVGYTDEETNNDIVVKRLEYKQQTGNELEFVELLPLGTPISANPTIITAKFSGNYAGGIKIRAFWTVDGVESGAEGERSTNLNPQVEIPNNYASLSKRTITFKYMLDGSADWIDIQGSITQSGATVAGSIRPDGNIPVEGGDYLCFLAGLYTGKVDVRCTATDGTEGEAPKVLASGTGEAGDVISLPVPPNTSGKLLNIAFEYSASGTNNWTTMVTRIQDAKSQIGHDGEITVGGYEDQKEIEKEVNVD